jgi:16S rRNA (cytidine1402-2'-O)-methyltransferase
MPDLEQIAFSRQLTPGLYLVATPIGTARDITLRALDVLTSADVIAAEDTRTARKLMDIHAVPTKGRRFVAYHDHSDASVRETLANLISEGKSVAYVSEAGTPMIADPGFSLARHVKSEGHSVTGLPGASAVIVALTVSGLPTDRFMFAGFPPNAQSARQTFLQEFSQVPATLVFYESPKRVHKCIADMKAVFGEARQASICRELTKKFEEVISGTLGELEQETRDRKLKGEIVICVDRNREEAVEADISETLANALLTMSVKDASDAVSKAHSVPKRRVYQMALEMEKNK